MELLLNVVKVYVPPCVKLFNVPTPWLSVVPVNVLPDGLITVKGTLGTWEFITKEAKPLTQIVLGTKVMSVSGLGEILSIVFVIKQIRDIETLIVDRLDYINQYK